MSADIQNIQAIDTSSYFDIFREKIESCKRGFSGMVVIAAVGFSNVAAISLIAIPIIFKSRPSIYSLGFGAAVAACDLLTWALWDLEVFYDYFPKLCKVIYGNLRSQFQVPILSNGTWDADCSYAHFHDPKLSLGLQTFFKSEQAASVADFGCGTGKYLIELKKEIPNLECTGYDGNPHTPKLTNGVGQVQNLAVPFKAENGPFDWTMSFEVGEHLPKEAEDAFLQNLCDNASKGVVLSWAKKGQGGHGHINEQNNDYIIEKMKEKGFNLDNKATAELRKSTSPYCFWFYDTVMVFRKA